MPVVRPCAICDGPGEGCFFGAFSCRCCAAFFRRSVRDDRQYECRGTGDCSINEAGMRNSCRACRLQRCLQNGMSMTAGGGEMSAKDSNSSRMGQRRLQRKVANEADKQGQQQLVSDSLPPIHDSPPSSLSSLSSSTAVGLQDLTAKVPPPFSATISGQFAKSTVNFKELLQAICAQHFGPDILLGHFERKLTHNDCMRLDKLSAPLYLQFVRTHFPELDSLQKSQKTELLHNFLVRFGFLLCLEMTAIQARKHPPPNGTVDKFHFFPNCVIDPDFEYFFSDVTGIGSEQQRIMSKAMQKEGLRFLQNCYLPLAICPLEFAALTGILFWNTVKKTVKVPQISTQLEALFLELHQVIDQRQANNNPSTSSIVRFGNLLTMLWDMTSMMDKDFNDLVMISNLFLDPNSGMDYANIWDKLL